MIYKTLQSEHIYRGRAFDVRRDTVCLPNGVSVNLDIVEHVGAVTILPFDSEGRVWFVRQYRHPSGVELLELPAGTLEVGEDPLTCAQREIQEEVGMSARRFQKIGEFFLAPGYSTEFMHVFLASDLYPSVLPQDEDEFLSVVPLLLDRAYESAKIGLIQDAKTLAALFLAQPYLGKMKS
jgi:ADP-ribose pyrophosphatase